MKHIGLFEGIGGFGLAALWMGWETIAWCEINEYCQQLLKQHFPNAKEHGDIKTTDFTIYKGMCDILTAGFPCQPFSIAGDQLGDDDPRFLFNQVLRAIRELRPRFVVAENVYAITQRKFEDTFHGICASLENEGYKVQPVIIPASSVGAPHERYRTWFIAHSDGHKFKTGHSVKEWKRKAAIANGDSQSDAHSDGERLQGNEFNGTFNETEWKEQSCKSVAELYKTDLWRGFPTQPLICRRDDGVPNWVDRIRSLGNAIVPQVALQIFRAIEQTDNILNEQTA
jgi:DNA (cytosine-5)-methyltransferase 1